jgi:hypothetical protein
MMLFRAGLVERPPDPDDAPRFGHLRRHAISRSKTTA